MEYVIILAAIVGAVIVVARVLRPKITSSYNRIGNELDSLRYAPPD